MGLSAGDTCQGGHGEDDDMDEGDHEEDGVLDEVSQRRQLARVRRVLQPPPQYTPSTLMQSRHIHPPCMMESFEHRRVCSATPCPHMMESFKLHLQLSVCWRRDETDTLDISEFCICLPMNAFQLILHRLTESLCPNQSECAHGRSVHSMRKPGHTIVVY